MPANWRGSLAIPTVMIPARPGALSAFGILVSDVVKDYSRTILWRFGDGFLPVATLNKEFQKLEASAQKEFRAEQWSGGLHYERSLDLRYRGQGYELNLPATAHITANFHAEHQKRYGYHHADREIELVTLRLRARLRTPRDRMFSRNARLRAKGLKRIAPMERAPVFFDDQTIATPVFERASLVPDRAMTGPAIITEYSATTVIPAGKKFWVDAAENLVVRISR